MSSPLHAQRGQALVEAALVMSVLLGVMLVVHATGVWQDEALRTGLAARQAAFAYTRFAPEPGYDIAADVNIALAARLTDEAQPGGVHRHAGVLRREWALGEADVTSVQAVVPMSHASHAGARLNFTRHTALLRGAGHSAGDTQVQQRVGQSALGWQTAARQSSSAGQAVAARLAPLDLAWGRAQPTFDWFSDWTARVPSAFLRTGGR